MKKTLKMIVIAIITILLLTNIVIADEKSDLQAQQEESERQQKEAEERKKEVQESMTETEREIQEVQGQIAEHESAIEALDAQIEELNSSIEQAEVDIEEKQQKHDETQAALDQRIIAIYESGETSFLDVLLGSESLTDMLSTYYAYSQLAQYDLDLMETLQKEKEELEAAKTKLEEDKNAVQDAKAQKEKESQELKAAKKAKDAYYEQLSEEDKKLADELEEFQEDQQAIEARLAEIAREEEEARRKQQEQAGSSGGGSYIDISGTPSSSGYISPIAGLSKANITTGFYGYAGHTGVDFSGGLYGREVRAVKDGTVEISRTAYGSIPNYGSDGNYVGSYRSYGEYIVINHHDGTMTLYAHGMPGSRKVQEGQEVKQGQVIMNVGNTGNVLPRPTSSDPLRGTHLHFEVKVNGRAVNPAPYLP